MVKRCDSVDALMYAYYEFMRIKEENQMLEKNKDYVEFTLQYTSVDWARSKDCPEVCLKGYSDFSFPGVPIMDVVCNEFDHKVVVVSKRDFDRLQADDQHYRELAKQREENYKALLDKTGFYNLADLMCYLPKDKTLKGIIDGLAAENEKCEKRIEALLSEIREWKTATGCISPKDISTHSLITKATRLDQEVKILNGALQEWREGTGCPGPIAAKALIESGMAYEHECHEAQEENRKLTEEVDSWKNVTGYSIPEDYMHARISDAFHTPFDYTAAWQKATDCDTPEAAKCRINNLIGEAEAFIGEAEAWESDYNHLLALTGFDNEGEIEDFLEQNNDRNKLTTVIDNLKLENETMKTALRASNRVMLKELENNIDEWQKFTGCDSPQKAGCKINNLCDGICKLKGDYDNLFKLTGYKSEQDIRILLHGDPHEYRSMRDLINSLKNRYKFSEANWQKATGCDTPGRAEEKFEFYKERLGKAVQAASCAAKHLENIMS